MLEDFVAGSFVRNPLDRHRAFEVVVECPKHLAAYPFPNQCLQGVVANDGGCFAWCLRQDPYRLTGQKSRLSGMSLQEGEKGAMKARVRLLQGFQPRFSISAVQSQRLVKKLLQHRMI